MVYLPSSLAKTQSLSAKTTLTYASKPSTYIDQPDCVSIGDQTRYRDEKSRFYYHNSVTGESVWEPPECFKRYMENLKEQNEKSDLDNEHEPDPTTEESKTDQSNTTQFDKTSTENDTTSLDKDENNVLEEKKVIQSIHFDEKGNKYYQNSVENRSQQSKPEDFDGEENSNETLVSKETAPPNKPTELIIPTNTEPIPKEILNVSPESKQNFFSLFEDNKIEFEASQKDILPSIVKDARYNCVKKLSQKKLLFEEQKNARKIEEKEKRDRNRAIACKQFMEMLSESKNIDDRMRYDEIEEMFREDNRFQKVDSSSRRKRLLKDYFKSVEKKVDENSKKRRHRLMNEFFQLLRHKRSHIKKSQSFSDLQHDKIFKNDSLFAHISSHLTSNDLKRVYNDFKDERKRRESRKSVENEKDKSKNESEVLLRRQCEEQAHKFYQFLEELLLKTDFIHAKTTQKEVLPHLSKDSRFSDFQKTFSEQFVEVENRKMKKDKFNIKSPQEIFEIYCTQLDKRLTPFKSNLKKFMKSKHIKVQVSDSLNELFAKVWNQQSNSDHHKGLKLNKLDCRLLLNEMIGKAKYLFSKEKASKKSLSLLNTTEQSKENGEKINLVDTHSEQDNFISSIIVDSETAPSNDKNLSGEQSKDKNFDEKSSKQLDPSQRIKHKRQFSEILHKLCINQCLDLDQLKQQLSSHRSYRRLNEDDRRKVFDKYMKEITDSKLTSYKIKKHRSSLLETPNTTSSLSSSKHTIHKATSSQIDQARKLYENESV